jgi:hypothetical protein
MASVFWPLTVQTSCCLRNEETAKAFGTIHYGNQQHQNQVAGEHAYAHASVLYDVLNRIALDAVLAPAHSYEVELAKGHLNHTKPGDLVIYDRGYCSFRVLKTSHSEPSPIKHVFTGTGTGTL